MALVSSLMYAAWVSLVFLSIKMGMSLYYTGSIVFLSGSAISVIYALGAGERPSAQGLKTGVLAGILFFVGNVAFFYALGTQYMSSAYPFIPASILVYFALSLRKFGSKGSSAALIVAGVLISSSGLILGELNAGDIGMLSTSALGVGLIILLFYGVAGYIVTVNSRESISSIVLSTMSTEFALFFLSFLIERPAAPSRVGAVLVSVAGGIAIALAFLIETSLFGSILRRGREALAGVNSIYIISNGDAIFVMLLAIALNTYTVYSILGLLLVYIGVVILQLV